MLRTTRTGLMIRAMNAKHTLLVVLFWTLFLAPSACLSGYLDHGCFSCAEVSCGHEDDCISDPCNIIMVPRTDARSIDISLLDVDISLDLPQIAVEDIAFLVTSLVTPPLEPDVPTLPLPASALPLVC